MRTTQGQQKVVTQDDFISFITNHSPIPEGFDWGSELIKDGYQPVLTNINFDEVINALKGRGFKLGSILKLKMNLNFNDVKFIFCSNIWGLQKSHFKNCEFINSAFSDGRKFSETIFFNCTFNEFQLNHATFKNTHFTNCEFISSKITNIKGLDIDNLSSNRISQDTVIQIITEHSAALPGLGSDDKMNEFDLLLAQERKRWSLLDWLQNEIIQFNYFTGERTKEKSEYAKQAMRFLLQHRGDNDNKLIESVLQANDLNPILLGKLKDAIGNYQPNPVRISQPSRGFHQSMEITADIHIKLQREANMITVGSKPGGANPGRLKVKRISAVEGKPSEVEKYLSLWLEKDLNLKDDKKYTEPVGGSIAHATYTSGTPKARILEYDSGVHSAINKFANELILAKDILKHQNLNSNDESGKLLGLPAVGLVGLLVTSGFILRNTYDLNLENFGVIPQNGKTRFFLFDFDTIQLLSKVKEQKEDRLLIALDSGDISLVKNILKTYIEDHIPEQESELIPILKKLIDDYDDKSILSELSDLIKSEEIFTHSSPNKNQTLLKPEQISSIQARLVSIQKSIQNFESKMEEKVDTKPVNRK